MSAVVWPVVGLVAAVVAYAVVMAVVDRWLLRLSKKPSVYEAEERRILDEATCQKCPTGAPTGEHDRYPQMADEVRGVCIRYLESMYALPDAEVPR